MENEILGSIYGNEGFLHLVVEEGFPMLRLHGNNEELKGKIKFEDVCMLDNFIMQLEGMKRALFLKRKK